MSNTDIPFAILRPAVIFAIDDILLNNITWKIRKFPIFGIFGDGKYRLQPIYAEDFSKLAVEQAESSEDTIVNAIGPETFEYRELIEKIMDIINVKRPIVKLSPILASTAGNLMGFFLRDNVITKQKIDGLMSNKLYVKTEPVGTTKLTDWLQENKESYGLRYANELARRK